MMTRTELISTAGNLVQPEHLAASEYADKMHYLVEMINKRMLERKDIEDLVGADNLDMMKDNHANHARFMESVFYNYVPEVLVDTILWVFRAYRSRNFKSTYWAAQLNGWMEIYKSELSKDCYEEIVPFYKWMQIHIPDFNALAETETVDKLSTH